MSTASLLRRIAVILLLAMSLAASLASASRAQEPPAGLQIQAYAAYDGHVKYGEWLPIWVQLDNNGPDLRAEVQVPITRGGGTVTFGVPIDLPSGAHKRLPVYVSPNNFSHELTVHLVRDGNILISQKIEVNPKPNINYFIGLVTPERGALNLLGGISLPSGRPHALIDIRLEDLPERAEGLASFDCLILNNVDTSSLTPGQVSALESWVREGGRLVIGGGAGALQTTAGLPAALLPLTPREFVDLDRLSGLATYAQADPIRVPGPFFLATGEVNAGITLASEGETPLVHEITVGAGDVDFVALDLAATPFDAWSGTTSFWETLLSPGAIYPDWLPPDISPRQLRASQMQYPLSNLPSLDLPSIRGLGLLLVVYILLVGPANYLLLRWRKRMHFAWITIPAITLAFTGATFSLSYALRGNDLLLNTIALIELHPEGDALITTFAGLFSPARQSYEIEVRDANLLSPLPDTNDPWGLVRDGAGSPATFNTTFIQGNPGRIRGLAVNQWSMQSFMTEVHQPAFGQVRGDLQVNGETLEGTLTNHTDYPLDEAFVIFGNEFAHLGDVRPAETVPVRLNLTQVSDPRFGPPWSYWMFENDQLRQALPPREIERRRTIVDALFQSPFGPDSLPMGMEGPKGTWSSFQGPLLIAWIAEPLLDVRVNGRPVPQQNSALLFTPLSFKPTSGRDFRLPPGLIPGALVEQPANGGMCDLATSVWLERGEAVFEFQLPEAVQDLQVDALQLKISSDGMQAGTPAIAVFDWQDQAWGALSDPAFGINVLPSPSRLISADGRVRVRLASQGFNSGGCIYLALGLEGTP